MQGTENLTFSAPILNYLMGHKRKHHNPPKGVAEAMKNASREEYGFYPARTFQNKKKYKREKISDILKKDLEI